MKKMFFSLSAVLLLGACSANVIVRRLPYAGKSARVAVLPVKPHPAYPPSGELAYEALSTYILEVKGYSVVDRGALDQILKEQKLATSGIIDQGKAIEIGKLLGAEAVLLGAVTQYVPRNLLLFPPAKVSITARLVSTKTGDVEWTATRTCGGLARWLTWIIPVVGAYATITSPSAEDQVQRASRSIFKTLERKRAEETAPQPV